MPEWSESTRRDVATKFVGDAQRHRMTLQNRGRDKRGGEHRYLVAVVVVHHEPVDERNPGEVPGNPVAGGLGQKMGVLDRISRHLVGFERMENEHPTRPGHQSIRAAVGHGDVLGQARKGPIEDTCARGAGTGHASTIGVNDAFP